MPRSNEFFWEQKIKPNKARDIANDYVLQTEEWRVIRIWECEIKKMSTREERPLFHQIPILSRSCEWEENLVIMAAESPER